MKTSNQNLHDEAQFHDEWADSVDITKIDVRQMCEACTAPELRYIRATLGDLHGKRLLDVGCGLGEAGVYFATLGAQVTLTDLSAGMLRAAERLAVHHGVSVRIHQGAAETLKPQNDELFDIIYVGNAFHHIDITKTLDQLLPLLRPDGVLVSWDPMLYNPLIQLYRRLAKKVRTEEEHPLKAADVRLITCRFEQADTKFFWLFTQAVFIAMFALQWRHPGKERYWKKVIEEANRWAPIYQPLEFLDRIVLCVFPFLGWLCWNVVIVARRPRYITRLRK
ncbi:MAG: class I SAM-dependent methyltransferase [bacterium]